MAVPPRGDPLRPVALAVNAARALGGVSIAIGALAIIGVATLSGGPGGGEVLFAAMLGTVVLFVLPGILYFLFAGHLKQYKTWAAVVLMVMAGIHCLVILASLGGTLFTASRNERYGEVAGQVVFYAIFLAVGILLIVYLSQSFKVIGMYGR